MTTAPRDPLEAIEQIRASLAYLRAGPESARWLASVLDAYLSGAPDGLTFEQCAGLATLPGRLPWWRAEAALRRGALIRALRDSLVGVLGERVGPSAIAVAITTYERELWPRDRERVSVPASYRGTPAEHLYSLFRLGDAPASERQLRRILRL